MPRKFVKCCIFNQIMLWFPLSCAVFFANFVGARASFEWLLSSELTRDAITEGGVVRGQVVNGEYVAFLGIPYAAPPTANNRFKAPLPPPEWHGIYEANRTVICPQQGYGDEDCLVVNVFTPIRILNGSLPVMVYIHGGSFVIGSGQTSGVTPLIEQDIVVVTLNYRLGALGFLCLGIEGAPGNAGLKDQVAALKWVKKNIANFGGDPNQVTIYGMSAGGASVEYQVLSKMGKGLFQRAVVESASVIPVWTKDADPITTAKNVAVAATSTKIKKLNKLLDFYQRIPAKQLSVLNFEYYNNLTDGTFGFVPCVETVLQGIEPFITESPNEILNKGKYDQVPMIIAYATLEGLFLRSPEYYERNYKERMEENFLDFLPADLVFDSYEIRKANAQNIKTFYFGDNPISDDTLIEYLNYFGDYLVMNGLLNSAEIHSRNNNTVYLIELAYKGNMGSYESFYNKTQLAGHGDLIKHAICNKPITNDDDKLAVARVAKLIANFVKFGNPTPNRTRLVPILWPEVRPGNVSCLHLDKDFQVVEEPYWDRKEFWDHLYSKYRRSVKPVDPTKRLK